MDFYSPLRYPGGKNKLAKFIAKICIDNNINGHYVEPYAGGASVALFLLFNDHVSEITINDKDRSIYAFWHSVLNNSDKLCKLIEKTDIDIKSWREQKEIQKNKEKADLLKLGFSTFFLNRTNHSGIIDGGIIGGIKQKGKYKIDCRFNKKELITRIKKIASYKNKINLYGLDAKDLIKNIQKDSRKKNIIFYFDPPYYLKGESLYMNYYNHDNHEEIGKMIKKIKNAEWIVSYDNVKEIRKIYKFCKNVKKLSYCYTARVPRIGKEIIFFSKKLNIPSGNPLNCQIN